MGVAGPNRLVKLLKPQIDEMRANAEADARRESNNDEGNDGGNGNSNIVKKHDEVKEKMADDDGDTDLSLSSVVSLSASRQSGTTTTTTDATHSLLELLIQGCSDPLITRSSEDLSMALSLVASLCEPLEA